MKARGLSFFVLAMLLAPQARSQDSPLQVVIDGREAAASDDFRLTEAGVSLMAQQGANIVMFVCGGLAVALTAWGLWELYQSASPDTQFGQSRVSAGSAVTKLIIAGLITIPAIIAAIMPYALL